MGFIGASLPGDGDGREHEKQERREQGDHVVPASLLLSHEAAGVPYCSLRPLQER
jgi:hypothetical protein